MTIDEIKKCFGFESNDEYTNATTIKKENLEKLKNHGWDVSMDVPGYIDCIAVSFKNMRFGFNGYINNLNAFVITENSNGDDDYQDIEIANRAQLDNFIEMIDCAFRLANLMEKND